MPPSFWVMAFALSVGWVLALSHDDTCPTTNPVIYRIVGLKLCFAIVLSGFTGITLLEIIWEAS